MKIVKRIFGEVLLMKPEVHFDDRGYFFESFRDDVLFNNTGVHYQFPQDNVSRSKFGVIRGLHYQLHTPNGKIVRVSKGKIIDVVVDIRSDSETFRMWDSYEISEDNFMQLWIPPGFAHGFITKTEVADVIYRTTEYHAPENQRVIRWNDPDININWPIEVPPILSQRDSDAPFLKNAELP